MIEVNVTNEWDMDLLSDLTKSGGIFGFWNGDTHQFATGLLQLQNLGHHLGNQMGIRCGHGLDSDGVVSPNRNASNHYNTGFMSNKSMLIGHKLSLAFLGIHEAKMSASPFMLSVLVNDRQGPMGNQKANRAINPSFARGWIGVWSRLLA